jgi:RNA polymerase sigma factor (sigma-70 family)
MPIHKHDAQRVVERPSPEAVWRLCGTWIRRTAVRIRDRMPWAEVDDLVQLGAMTALELRDRFDPAAGYEFLSFVRPRVYGAMIDWLRHQGAVARQATAENMPEYQYDNQHYDLAITILIRMQNMEALMAGIDALPDDERTALSLFYLEEFANKDVAIAMNISEGHATRLRHRAIRRLADGIGAATQPAPRYDLEMTDHES